MCVYVCACACVYVYMCVCVCMCACMCVAVLVFIDKTIFLAVLRLMQIVTSECGQNFVTYETDLGLGYSFEIHYPDADVDSSG